MTTQDDINAMGDILAKLNSATVDGSTRVNESSTSPVTAGDPDIAAMANILNKLNEATEQVVTQHAPTDVDLRMAITTEPIENGVTISRYDIRTEKQMVAEGLQKTMYQVIDNRQGRVVYDELCLFESAMGIVKGLLSKRTNKIDRIRDLDQHYLGHMIESYSHKRKLKTLMEDTSEHDVSSAKYTLSRDKMAATKMKLLKTL